MDYMKITDANDMNVPINVDLYKEVGGWVITADNLQTRKSVIKQAVYMQYFTTKKEAMTYIKDIIVPLYRNAIKRLLADGHLGMWTSY